MAKMPRKQPPPEPETPPLNLEQIALEAMLEEHQSQSPGKHPLDRVSLQPEQNTPKPEIPSYFRNL